MLFVLFIVEKVLSVKLLVGGFLYYKENKYQLSSFCIRWFANLSPCPPFLRIYGDLTPFNLPHLTKGEGRFLRRGANAPLGHPYIISSEQESQREAKPPDVFIGSFRGTELPKNAQRG
jgi:hypothetical protein